VQIDNIEAWTLPDGVTWTPTIVYPQEPNLTNPAPRMNSFAFPETNGLCVFGADLTYRQYDSTYQFTAKATAGESSKTIEFA